LLLEVLCVIDQLVVSAVEIWVLVSVALDDDTREPGLAVVDAVDSADLVVGEVGEFAADRDAGKARDLRAVGRGEQPRGVGLDRDREVAHPVLVRRGRMGWCRQVPILDGAQEAVEFSGETPVLFERVGVSLVAASDVVRVAADDRGDCRPGGERGAT